MRPLREPQLRIAFLLGKPVHSGTVFPEVFDQLRRIPAAVRVHVPKGDEPLPSWVSEAELIVQRGLGMCELRSARRLEELGVRCCNPIAATIAVGDRALTSQKLADAALPIPVTVSVDTWPEVLDLANGQPAVVKAADGRIGRGLGVLVADTGSLPPRSPFAGPYIVQEYVHGDGRDYKVYVAGCQAKGLVKRRSFRQASETPGEPFTIDAELADVARLAGRALDLEIYGVDFLSGPRGPVIIDVNPFPGFRDVAQSARLIADYLATIARGHKRDVQSR